MASDIADAIARAQAWLAKSPSPQPWTLNGYYLVDSLGASLTDSNDGEFFDLEDARLARLGPPSVALAVALEAWAEWELTLEGVDYQITPPNGLADVKKLGRDALQDWADAQHSDAEGA